MTHEEFTEQAVACTGDMSQAADSLTDFRELFDAALIGRDRSEAGIRFRFRADDSIERRVRHRAAIEAQCCPFFTFEIFVVDGEVWWDTSVQTVAAQRVLDDFYALPELLAAGDDAVRDRFVQDGLQLIDT